MAQHQLMIVKGLSPHEHEIQYCLTHGVQKVHPPASSLIYAHCKACPPQHLRRQWPHIPLRTKAPEHQSVPVTAEKLKEFCLSIFFGRTGFFVCVLVRNLCCCFWFVIGSTMVWICPYFLFWAQIFWRTPNEGVQQKELQMLLYISFYYVKSLGSFENLELKSLCLLCQASVKFARKTLCSLDHSSTKD